MDMYNINGRIPSKVDDIKQWEGMCNIEKRRVGYTDVNEDVAVSTVFLGLDHAIPSLHGNTPILFETMIMGGPNDGYQERYATWEQAEAGHARIVKIAAEPIEENE